MMQKGLFGKKHRRCGGFSLLEASAALGVMMVVGVSLVVMLQQHVTFMGLFQKQAFLTDEAPQTGRLLGRLLGQADSFLVYESRERFIAGDSPVLSAGAAVRLFFPSTDGEMKERWVSVEPEAPESPRFQLTFYEESEDQQSSWTICRGLAGADFATEEGILSVALQGPSGEEITFYSGGQ